MKDTVVRRKVELNAIAIVCCDVVARHSVTRRRVEPNAIAIVCDGVARQSVIVG
jgi:hypothetical protein